MTDGVSLRPAVDDADFDAFGTLVREYVAWLGIDLGYQGLDDELADLAARYGPPGGLALIAVDPGLGVLGGVAVKPLSSLGAEACEMKRLYVRPAGRARGLGAALAKAALAHGRTLGYRRMLLDTLPSRMPAAVALYRKLGFVERGPYYSTPIDETVFMEADLDAPLPDRS